MKAMILAAGRGLRMLPLTESTPKPLLKVGETNLIEHVIVGLRQASVTEIVINVSRYTKDIIQVLGDGEKYGVRITYSIEDEPLETGGGICKALPLLGEEPFIVVSSDVWTDFSFESLTKYHSDGAHIVLAENPSFHAQGDFALTPSGKVSMQGEKLTYASFGVFHPQLFKKSLPEAFPLNVVLKDAIKDGRVTGELYTGEWFNIGTPDIISELRKSVDNRVNTE